MHQILYGEMPKKWEGLLERKEHVPYLKSVGASFQPSHSVEGIKHKNVGEECLWNEKNHALKIQIHYHFLDILMKLKIDFQ